MLDKEFQIRTVPKIPKYTAKTVEEYNYYIKNTFHSDIDYLCFICEGAGTIYDEDDPPDPYEGNKLRRRVCCTACNGAKKDKKAFIKHFKMLKEEEKQKIIKYRNIMKILKQLDKKLTEVEFKTLLLYFEKY